MVEVCYFLENISFSCNVTCNFLIMVFAKYFNLECSSDFSQGSVKLREREFTFGAWGMKELLF